jgi:hypothetical protein
MVPAGELTTQAWCEAGVPSACSRPHETSTSCQPMVSPSTTSATATRSARPTKDQPGRHPPPLCTQPGRPSNAGRGARRPRGSRGRQSPTRPTGAGRASRDVPTRVGQTVSNHRGRLPRGRPLPSPTLRPARGCTALGLPMSSTPQTQKSPDRLCRWGSFTMYVRRRPTLPHRHQCSTIGAEGLSFRVRNGTGRFPFAMTAVTLGRYLRLGSQPHHMKQYHFVFAFPTVSRELHSGRVAPATESYCVSSYRLISTGQLHTLRCFHIRPINPVVSLGASHP